MFGHEEIHQNEADESCTREEIGSLDTPSNATALVVSEGRAGSTHCAEDHQWDRVAENEAKETTASRGETRSLGPETSGG